MKCNVYYVVIFEVPPAPNAVVHDRQSIIFARHIRLAKLKLCGTAVTTNIVYEHELPLTF